ncbi:MAG: hypothetical protein WC514_02200 [Candidatus Paceibacterota bacterium]
MKKIAFFSGTPMGYLAGSFFAGSSTGQQGIINSLILSLGNWQFHLHHWLIAALLLIFALFFLRKRYSINPTLFYFSVGILSGLILQGLFAYDDWHKVLFKKI